MGLALLTSTPVLTHSSDCKALNMGRRAANVVPQSEDSCLGVLLKGKQMLSVFPTIGAEFGLMDPRGDRNHLPFDIPCPLTGLSSSIFKWAPAPTFLNAFLCAECRLLCDDLCMNLKKLDFHSFKYSKIIAGNSIPPTISL